MRITITLIGMNVFVFIFENLFGGWFINTFSLVPLNAINGSYWQFITYMFLHANVTHILFNMFALFLFGVQVERNLGEKNFIILYLFSGIGSAIFHILLTGVSTVPMLGASGAVFGVLTAYGILYPRSLVLIPPGIPLPAIFAVFGFAIFEFFLGVFNLEAGVANFGHFGGIVAGLIFMTIWKKFKKKNQENRRLQDFEFIWE